MQVASAVRTLRRRFWTVFTPILVGTLLGFALSRTLWTQYQASVYLASPVTPLPLVG